MEYKNLDHTTRKFMLEEISRDQESEKIYFSPRLSLEGKLQWPNLLLSAAETGDDETLADSLRKEGLINATEFRNGKSVKVPVTAAKTLAEGEFNRFYARGVCRHALANGQMTVTVYRARHSSNPRPESEEKLGKKFDAKTLLEDLRINVGVDTALGLPAGPNSGLSVKL